MKVLSMGFNLIYDVIVDNDIKYINYEKYYLVLDKELDNNIEYDYSKTAIYKDLETNKLYTGFYTNDLSWLKNRQLTIFDFLEYEEEGDEE